MSKLRVLYVASEIAPFLQITEVAEIVRQIPQAMSEHGMEIRIIVPRYGTILERKHRLHEVVRLSGINIAVGDDEKPLLIKVASVPQAKLQVYFIDNDDFFHRKADWNDADGRFCADNDERSIFFCKGVLETVKKLGWSPDIIHCHDWMSAIIPLYLKTSYRKDPVFNQSKCIYSVYNNHFDHDFSADDLIEKILMQDIDKSDVLQLQEANYGGLTRLAMDYADAVVAGTNYYDAPTSGLLEEFASKKEIIKIEKPDDFHDLYNQVLATELVSVV
ncbi:MAG: glycogen synthase [Bacteroidetes bacterium]|nr:MAG: glycogen synthase [Bacteroidota bacterium]